MAKSVGQIWEAIGPVVKGLGKLASFSASGYAALGAAKPYIKGDVSDATKWLSDAWGSGSKAMARMDDAIWPKGGGLTHERPAGKSARPSDHGEARRICSRAIRPDSCSGRRNGGRAVRVHRPVIRGDRPLGDRARPHRATNVNVSGEVTLDGMRLGRFIQNRVKAEAARHGDTYGDNPLGYGVR